MDLQKLFAEAKKYEQAKSAPQKNEERVSDDRMLIMKAGNTYRCRLVYRLSKGSDRKLPFITKETHSSYNVEVPPGMPKWVVCPTSDHVKGRAGFKDCPICADLSKWYKEKDVSPASKKLYETFKRTSANHAVVYVVSDPVNPDNNGKMKIIKFGSDTATFLKWEVFGINLKDPNLVNDDAIGPKAFDFENGHDLIFTVSKAKFPGRDNKDVEFDKPVASFSRKATKIDVDEETLQEMFDALNFDRDFYNKTSQEDLLSWYNAVVLKNIVSTSSGNKKTELLSNDDEAEEGTEEDLVEEEAPPAPKKPAAKPVSVVEQSVKQKPKPPVASSTEEEVDLDDIMGIIDSIGK
jgi:hypothetical protein